MSCGEFNYINDYQPIQVAARSMVVVCDPSVAGIVGSKAEKAA